MGRVCAARSAPALIGDADDPQHLFCSDAHEKASTATRLFRNEEMFTALRNIVLPTMISRHPVKNWQIWSAGCSSGEEAYSLAMVAHDQLDRLPGANTRLEVFGTDINPQRLQEAKAGIYLLPEANPIATTYRTLLARYTLRRGARIRIGEEIRAGTKFGMFDLRRRPKRHTFHFIVCNHVMQYYEESEQRAVIGNLCAVLKLGGYLYIEGIAKETAAAANLKPSTVNKYLFHL